MQRKFKVLQMFFVEEFSPSECKEGRESKREVTLPSRKTIADIICVRTAGLCGCVYIHV